jgi:hypothetical protein
MSSRKEATSTMNQYFWNRNRPSSRGLAVRIGSGTRAPGSTETIHAARIRVITPRTMAGAHWARSACQPWSAAFGRSIMTIKRKRTMMAPAYTMTSRRARKGAPRR